MLCPPSPGSDDVARHSHWSAADGPETWRGQRGLRATREGADRRPLGLRGLHGFYRSGGLPHRPPKPYPAGTSSRNLTAASSSGRVYTETPKQRGVLVG